MRLLLLLHLIRGLPSFPAVAVFAAVDQDLSDRIAKAMGVPTVAPVKVAPASAAGKLKVWDQ